MKFMQTQHCKIQGAIGFAMIDLELVPCRAAGSWGCAMIEVMKGVE